MRTGINAAADLGKTVNLFAGYDRFGMHNSNVDGKDGVFNVGLNFKLGKDVKLGATYLHSSFKEDDGARRDAKNNGFIISAAYKGAKNDKPGSWGLAAKYYQVPAGFFVGPGWEDGHSATTNMALEGSKGWYVKADWAVAKNIIADIEYWDLKGRVDSCKSKTLWTALNFAF